MLFCYSTLLSFICNCIRSVQQSWDTDRLQSLESFPRTRLTTIFSEPLLGSVRLCPNQNTYTTKSDNCCLAPTTKLANNRVPRYIKDIMRVYLNCSFANWLYLCVAARFVMNKYHWHIQTAHLLESIPRWTFRYPTTLTSSSSPRRRFDRWRREDGAVLPVSFISTNCFLIVVNTRYSWPYLDLHL